MPKLLRHTINSLPWIILFVIASTLLLGMVYTFNPAQARSLSAASFLSGTASPVTLGTPTPEVTPEDTPAGRPHNNRNVIPEPANTTGMVIQGILIVLVILFGAFWGWRQSSPRVPRALRKRK